MEFQQIYFVKCIRYHAYFIIDENEFENFNGLGYLQVVITYQETGGLGGGPCDTVSVNIPPNGANADWQNPNNMLVEDYTIPLKL